MDEEQIRQLRPRLNRFLKRFDDCFSRKDTRAHLPEYVNGQLSDLPEKSVAPIARKAKVPPRTLQEFLSESRWSETGMRTRLQQIVASDHSGPHSVGVVDETSYVKKGDKTPGVKRQWCGAVGKKENCMVTVHLAYARDNFHCLLDSELFLPEDWAADQERRQAAGIPETMEYRPKWKIALEEYDRAVSNGIQFEWVTFDEGYGGKPGFLQGLTDRQQQFVGEVPKNFRGWIKPPRVTNRPFRRHRRGRGRQTPRLVTGSPRARTVEDLLLHDPQLRRQPWQPYRVKDGEKGPIVWEAKHTLFHAQDENGLPSKAYHLVIARNVLDHKEVKYFIGNAPPETKVEVLLRAGFSRWHVERCFQDGKGEVGLDHYEGRCYPGLIRHLMISAVSYLFLATIQHEWAKKKSGGDGLPDSGHPGGFDSSVVVKQAGYVWGNPGHRQRDQRQAA